MPDVAIVGGSVVGSAAALLLARAGWAVTLVDPELDLLASPAPGPVVARPGAPHTVQAHGFMSRTLHELSTRLPDVLGALLEAGVPTVPLAEFLPPHLYDGGRADDHELTVLRVRRVTLDRVLGDAVRRQDGVHRVPARVTGLVVDPGRPPRVRGLTVSGHGEVRADVVIDAGGRRSPVSRWLAHAGAAPVERTDAAVARYYTRHYTLRDGAPPPLNRGFAEVHDFPSLTQLLFLGDNETAMLAQAVHDSDSELKALRHPAAFDAAAAGNEEFARWWAVLEPASEQVYCLGAFDNRTRSLVAPTGTPLALGVFQVGDALAMTNPTRGRGISMGLAAVGHLHDLLVYERASLPQAALAYDAWCRRVLDVYYRESAAADAANARRLRAGLLGQAVPANAPVVELPDGHPVSAAELDRAAAADPDLIRVVIRATMLMDDTRVVASADVAERVRRVLPTLPTPPAPAAPTGRLHDRAALTALLAPWAR